MDLRRCKVINKYLPEELWREVFYRVPVKSLLRLRSVSKSFCNIIDDPVFISVYPSLYPNNRIKTHIIAYKTVRMVVDDPEFEDEVWELSIRSIDNDETTTTLLQSSVNYFNLIDEISKHTYFPHRSVNGLILIQKFACMSDEDRKMELSVWNPCVRKCLRLPPSPFACANPDHHQYDHCVYALGTTSCNSNNNADHDYKVAAFRRDHPPRHDSAFSVAVYAISEGFWRIKTSFELGPVPSWWFPRWKFAIVSSSFHGTAHWLVNSTIDILCGYSTTNTHVISFDFNVMEFTSLELPHPDEEYHGQELSFLFLLGHSVAVLMISRLSISIWVMDKDKDGRMEQPLSWTWTRYKFYSGNSNSQTCYDFFRAHVNDHQCHPKILYVEKTGLFLMNIGGYLNSFDIANQQVQPVYDRCKTCLEDFHVESLMFSKGFEGQSLTSFP